MAGRVCGLACCGTPSPALTSVQELTGLELSALIEDPEHASVRVIAAEALGRSGASGGGSRAVARIDSTWARWVAPAPFTVKMRLFCLPYAGGVSENVFARCALTSRFPSTMEHLQQQTWPSPDLLSVP